MVWWVEFWNQVFWGRVTPITNSGIVVPMILRGNYYKAVGNRGRRLRVMLDV